MLLRFLALIVAGTLTAGTTQADDPKKADEEVKAAQERLAEYLKGIQGADAGRVAPLADGTGETFPDHVLFSLVFPQYPVARVAPEPFQSANVVAVPKKKDGKPVVVPDAKQLTEFFKKNARPVKTAAEGEAATKAWLRASAELVQDGFFRFTVKADAAKVDGGTVTCSGVVTVDPNNGDKGDIKSTLTFKDGVLNATETKINLVAGMRPRCQATKLLDPDPIVRGMAEDAIRMMGSSAKPYLDEQRAKANAELREAIDRAWAKIVAEKR